MERVYWTGGVSGMSYTQVPINSKEKEAKRNKRKMATALFKLWIMAFMWKLWKTLRVYHSYAQSLGQPCASLRVDHITHNSAATIFNIKRQGVIHGYILI